IVQRSRGALPDLEPRNWPVHVRSHRRGERHAVPRHDVVVRDQRNPDQPVDVAHESLQTLADDAAARVGTPRAYRPAVVVEAGDARIAGGERLALQSRGHAGLLEPTDTG